ncbi:MAG: hypothetical protein KDK37_10235 [Leptospiraceae bacterium]|nr:hypothetical protein [Leptospiraceae bacterium]MCB1304649.1 hypothetical protein [Leptospiraceae bacterium]
MPEPMSRRKKGRRRYWIWIFPILLAAGGVLYGQDLLRYAQVRFSSDSLLRLEDRTAAFLSSYERLKRMEPPRGSENPAEEPFFKLQTALYQQIDENRKIIEIIARNEDDPGTMAALRGKYAMFELLLRIHLDSRNLVELAGRGFLPPQRPTLLEEKSPGDLAFQVSQYMRRALAYDPDAEYASVAHLGVALGDLMYFGRTDLAILDHLRAIEPAKLPPELREERLWISAALYCLLGQPEDLDKLLKEPGLSPEPGTSAESESTGLENYLTNYQKQLLHGYALFQAKRYMQALYSVRTVKYDQSIPSFYRAEAARMEGEINGKQNGPYFAIPYLEEALRISGDEDPFLRERLSSFLPKSR